MRRFQLSVFCMGFFALAAACTPGANNPPTSSPSVKKGELGNGGFTFRCDDSVACDKYSNAKTFPDAIALGSTFEIEFFLRDDWNGYGYLRDAERGTTIEPVGKYIGRGTSGFAAVDEGTATLSARDQKGWLVDYVIVPVRKPDSLIIYDSEYTGDNPTRLARVTMDVDDHKGFRVVGQRSGQPLAGLITIEWSSSDSNVVAVEGYSRGKVSIVALKNGTATLSAKGGGLAEPQTVDVVVGDVGSGGDAGSDAAQDAGGQ